MNSSDAIGVIGYMAVVVFAVTGAYVWLRWGCAGVAIIWASRKVIDERVQTEAREIIKKK